MVALAPLAVDVSSTNQDSSVTSLMIAAGAGSYADVSRGCQGEVLSKEQRRYRDLGFAANHGFAGPLEVGVRASVLRRMPGYEDGTVMWNPNVAVEGRHVGFGLGYVSKAGRPFSDEFDIWPVSGHLRFGSLSGVHFSVHALEDVPLVSGGGTVRSGFGFRPSRAVDAWVGVGYGPPYDKPGFQVKSAIHLNSMLDLNANGRLGGSEGQSENAGSLGLTVRLTRDRKPASLDSLRASTPPLIDE